MNLNEPEFMSQERLWELLLELEQARNWERELRQESETLLEGLKVLALSNRSENVFPRLLQVLQVYLGFERAWVLLAHSDEQMCVMAFSEEADWNQPLSLAHWPIGRFFKRLIKGKPSVVYDVLQIPEWQHLPSEFLAEIGSALHIPLPGLQQTALLIAVHSQKSVFGPRHLSLAGHLSFLASQALRQLEFQQELQRLNQELELRVLERTQELEMANRALNQAARLKDEFLANMSHELRTPLTAVLGLTELISREILGPLTPKQSKSLGTIQESGKHLLSLINDVLDLAKIEAGKTELLLEPVNLQELGSSVVEMVHQLAENKHIRVSFSCQPFDLQAYFDVQKLRQVLLNLLSNAIKFTPEEGQVELKIEENKLSHAVIFSVKDTGIGIAEADRERLFQPFVQIDRGLSRRYGGTGLGLTLVKKIADLHGGCIQVESQPGQGSLFQLILPGDKTVSHPVLKCELAEKSEKAKILVVDDHLANLDLFSEYLQFLGYQTVLAHGGADALDLLKKDLPALILTDIQMPEMSGLELIEKIKAQDHLLKIPIVALTSLNMPWEKSAIMKSGADFYLSKPVDLKVLQQILNSYLENNLGER
ncbi:hypothetical protein COW20_02705 [bacterium (Candidatus Blackallbacteria) CG13_big_fil_rev_8_21_14_2_50_49_14]|nr:MAG: hypothetical protein COW20_02705 [bacterium (Candidatus Blackallbacteria) CG13_big_fil_rev_8_21_14_2_50_49_14]